MTATYQERLAEILRGFVNDLDKLKGDPCYFDELTKAQTAINALNAETIGEDEDIGAMLKKKEYYGKMIDLRRAEIRNKVHIDLRQRFGVDHE